MAVTSLRLLCIVVVAVCLYCIYHLLTVLTEFRFGMLSAAAAALILAFVVRRAPDREKASMMTAALTVLLVEAVVWAVTLLGGFLTMGGSLTDFYPYSIALPAPIVAFLLWWLVRRKQDRPLVRSGILVVSICLAIVEALTTRNT